MKKQRIQQHVAFQAVFQISTPDSIYRKLKKEAYRQGQKLKWYAGNKLIENLDKDEQIEELKSSLRMAALELRHKDVCLRCDKKTEKEGKDEKV
jgi:hypothetical protein